MSAQRPSLYVGRRGVVVGWHGPLGPAVAFFESFSRQRPLFARTLGRAGADLPATPVLWATSDALVVAWCEEDGVKVAALGWDGALGEPVLAAPGARTLAMGSGREGATLFAADSEGITVVELDGRGRPGAPVRAVSERRGGIILSASRIRNEGVLAYAHPGAEGWGLVAATDTGPVAVKHPEGGCESFHVASVGSRAACVFEGDGALRLGIFGPGGRVVERPHAVFGLDLPRLRTPQVTWMDEDWLVAAREPRTDTLRMLPLSPLLEPFTLPQCTRPFALAYHARHLYTLQIEPTPDGGELWLGRCQRDGGAAQQRHLALALDDRRPRRVGIEARSTLSRIGERVRHRGGYREAGYIAELSRDGSTLRIEDERGRLRLRVTPEAETIAMQLSSALGDDLTLPEAPTSLVRLARWVRLGFSAAARSAVESERRWAETLATALDATLRDVQRAGSTLVLELILRELPPPDPLYAWLGRVRDEQAARGHSHDGGGVRRSHSPRN